MSRRTGRSATGSRGYDRRRLPLAPRGVTLDWLVRSPLCQRCPHGPAGCCESPPAFSWVDLGRIAGRAGGVAFLLVEIAAGRLLPGRWGLRPALAPAARPLPARCGYLLTDGCALRPELRSATCNFYLCDEALAGESPDRAATVRETRDALARCAGRWDEGLDSGAAARRAAGGFDEALLRWLADEVARLADRTAPDDTSAA